MNIFVRMTFKTLPKQETPLQPQNRKDAKKSRIFNNEVRYYGKYCREFSTATELNLLNALQRLSDSSMALPL
jgi:hypothetical protein